MTNQGWSADQSRSNEQFTAKLDEITQYLADGKWKPTYTAWTEPNGEAGDPITGTTVSPDNLSRGFWKFKPLKNGTLRVTKKSYDSGEKTMYRETYIGSVQPFDGSLYLASTDDGDIVFGRLDRSTDSITFSSLSTLPELDAGLYQVINTAV